MQERVPDERGYGAVEGGVFASILQEAWTAVAELGVWQSGGLEPLDKLAAFFVSWKSAHQKLAGTRAEREAIRHRSPAHSSSSFRRQTCGLVSRLVAGHR